jgi:branched-chain amino acid transport system permease protein
MAVAAAAVDRRLLIRRGLFLAAMLAVVAGPFLLPPFYVTLMTYVGLAALVSIGLVLLTGIGGQTSFGQAAFAGLAAYTTALLSHGAGWSPWLTLPVALALTAVAALLIGLVTVRLSGHYLGLATMAWGTSAYYLMGTLPGLGGYNGIPEIPGLPFLSRDSRWMLIFLFALVLTLVMLTRNLLDSRQGRAIRALAGGRLMAESMGVNTALVALWIFVISALYAALSGWLYAHVQGFVNPSPFGLTAGIEYLFMVIIGGAGSLFGAVLGATVVTVLRDQLNDLLPRLLGQPGNFEGMVFAAVVVLALQRLPRGLVPSLTKLLPRPKPRVVMAAPALPQAHAPAGGTVLEVEGVSRRFGGLLANDKVGFCVRAGQIMALIGPNGAGKSTLFNLIGGLLRPDSGRITLQGRRIDGLTSRHIARAGVARTFQHVRLLPELSVLENIALGAHLRGRAGMLSAMLRLDRAEERRLLAEAARQAARLGLSDHLHLPAGDLSLGLQRIVEIARALCLDPVLLLLDEPAAGLRLQEKRQLADLLRGLRGEGVAVLLVEHDMDFVMGLADRVVVMEFGRTIAEGTPEQVQADPRVLDAYLGGVEA